MTGLARFVLRGPAQAVLVVSAFGLAGTLLPLLFPFAMVISGAALVLVALCNPPASTAAVVALSQLVVMAALWAAGLEAFSLVTLGLWVATAVCAEVYRRSDNLAMALLAAEVVVTLAVLALFAAVAEPSALWLEALDRLRGELGSGQSPVPLERLEQFSKLITGALATVMLIIIAVSQVIGGLWRSRLLDAGRFRREFHGLRLGRVLTLYAAVLVGAAVVRDSELLIALSAVAVAVYLFQGLAVVHAFAAAWSKSPGWLIAFYVLLVVLEPFRSVVIVFGIADAWIDTRRRWLANGPARGGPNDE